jgi:hypothetical protein
MDAYARTISTEYTDRGSQTRGGAWGIGLKHFRGFLLVLIAIALACVFAFLLFKQQIHEQLRTRLLERINEKLVTVDAHCDIEQSRFINGRGILIRNLNIYDNKSTEPVVSIAQLEIGSVACFADLLTENVCPTNVVIKGARIRDDVNESKIQRWITALLPDQFDQKQPLVPIRIRNSEISLTGVFLSTNTPLTFHQIDLDITPDKKRPDAEYPAISIQGSLQGNLADKIDIRGVVDINRDYFRLDLDTKNAALDNRILKELPGDIKDRIGPLTDLKAVVDLTGWCEGRFSEPDQIQFEIDGRLSDARINSGLFPHSLSDGQATFNVSNNGFEFSNVVARFGLGSIQLFYRQQGLFHAEQYDFRGKVERLIVDNQINCFLPEAVADIQNRLSFEGAINATFVSSLIDGNPTKDLTIQLLDTSFAFESFPFRFSHCLGTIHWDGSVCKSRVQAIENDQMIEFRGVVPTLQGTSAGWMEVEVHGSIPIDEKVVNAFRTNPDSQRTLRAFNPTGRFGYFGRFDQSLENSLDWNSHHYVDLQQCSIRFENFDYPIHNVSGKIEVINGVVNYKNIKGDHNGGTVLFNGTWDSANGLNLDAVGQSIAFDEDLRSALPDQYRALWNQLQPQGSLDQVKVNFTVPAGTTQVNTVIEAEKFGQKQRSVTGFSIKPSGFPYSIHDLSGWFKAENGRLTMQNVQGYHGGCWFQSDGSGEFSESGWSISLDNLIATGVKVDHELMSALPNSMANSIRSVQFNGQVNLQGNLRFGQYVDREQSQHDAHNFFESQGIDLRYDSLGQQPEQTPFFEWRDLRIDLDGASIYVGLPVKNLRGSVTLTGQSTKHITQSVGQLDLDSTTIHDIQVTDMHGPIWFDQDRLNFGTFAHTASQQLPATVSGDVYGGKVSWDAQFSLKEDQRFFVQATVADADLTQFAQDQMPARSEISGRGFMTMQMGGSCKSLHALRGNGNVKLRNAQIYQIPVILSLLKILSVSEVNRTAFNESNIDFTLQGEDIDLQRIELIGDAVSLIGNGKLDLSRNIDLNFYTVVGRNRLEIPLVSQLYKAGSQQILLLRVDGTLDNPQTHRDVIPHINDSLQAIIDELKPGKEASKQKSGLRFINPFNY